MNAPELLSSKTVCEIKKCDGNPRNSEGDFARLNNGDILFAYSRYHGSSFSDDAACDIAGLISHDNGDTFEPLPHLLAKAEDHGVSNIMSVTLRRLKNGDLCLFYLCKKGPQSAMFLRRATGDETTFGEAEICIPFTDDTYYVVNNCRISLLDDGRVLIPAAKHKILKRENGESAPTMFADSVFFIGDSEAKNFHPAFDALKLPNPSYSGTGLQEPGSVILPDGRIFAYFRTDLGCQFGCFIDKNCTSAGVPVQLKFTSPASPMLVTRNPFGGRYYSIYNPVPNYNGRYPENSPWITAGRTPLVISASDNGVDYSSVTVLEDDPEKGFCYPAVFYLSEKEFLVSYCFGGKDEGNCLTCTRIRKVGLK